jgi:hypothetical protein
MKKSCDELMTLGDSTAFDPVPNKRGNRPIEVLELDLSGLHVPVQPIDATPFNASIQQRFTGRADLFDCTR